jgi:hypothetical protein
LCSMVSLALGGLAAGWFEGLVDLPGRRFRQAGEADWGVGWRR